MTSFVIDPDAKTVEEVLPEEGDFLDWVRKVLGVPQVAVMPMHESTIAVWCDNMGMIKHGRNFWSFKGNDFRFAGKAMITRINTEDGTPAPFPPELTAAIVKEGLLFHPSEDLVRIREQLVLVRDPEGRPIPGVARTVEWKHPPELDLTTPEAIDDISSGWTIFEKSDGTYKAERYALEDDELRLVEMRSAPNLDAMRAKLPPGLERIEADEREEAVEHWLLPLPPEEG